MPYFRAFSAFWLRSPYLWIQSLSWWISIVTYFDIQVNPYWNRTLTYHFLNSKGVNHGWTLGGACYIHLTMRTNPVFSGFSAFSATVAFFMNSITLVMNFSFSYFNISIDFVQLELFFSTFFISKSIVEHFPASRCFLWNVCLQLAHLLNLYYWYIHQISDHYIQSSYNRYVPS